MSAPSSICLLEQNGFLRKDFWEFSTTPQRFLGIFHNPSKKEGRVIRYNWRVVATVEDSVLRTEMENLESEGEDAPRRVLYFKPMSWLGQIRPHRRDEAWSASLWQTFFASCVGANIPALAELPLSACGCRKFQIDTLEDHLCTCTAHSGAEKAHDSAVDQIADLFAQPTK